MMVRGSADSCVACLLVRRDPGRRTVPPQAATCTRQRRSSRGRTMTVVVGLLVGAVTVLFLRIGGPVDPRAPALQRVNYRGVSLPTAGGILIVLAVLVIEAGRADPRRRRCRRRPRPDPGPQRGAVRRVRLRLPRADRRPARLRRRPRVPGPRARPRRRPDHDRLREAPRRRGRGGGPGRHARFRHRPSPDRRRSAHRARRRTSRTCSTSRPGGRSRVPPSSTCRSRSRWATTPSAIAMAPGLGAAFGLLPDDLGERLMLGDTGAKVIGAVLGVGVVLGHGEHDPHHRARSRCVVANIAAEAVSFSRVIDRVRPAARLDRLGQLRGDGATSPGQRGSLSARTARAPPGPRRVRSKPSRSSRGPSSRLRSAPSTRAPRRHRRSRGGGEQGSR